MATNIPTAEQDKRKDTSGDVANLEADGGAGVDSHGREQDESVSMFCKTCLHPYSGQQKAGGTLVLRCMKCGQTDIVVKEKAAELNAEDWQGNLMMNRFLTIVKTQQEMSLNITQPEYKDDEYGRLPLVLDDYQEYMTIVAENLRDCIAFAKEMQDNKRRKETEDHVTEDGTEDGTGHGSVVSGDDPGNHDSQDLRKRHMTEILTTLPMVDRINMTGHSISKIIRSLIQKHDMPAETWDNMMLHLATTDAVVVTNTGSNGQLDVVMNETSCAPDGRINAESSLTTKTQNNVNDDLVTDTKVGTDKSIKQHSNVMDTSKHESCSADKSKYSENNNSCVESIDVLVEKETGAANATSHDDNVTEAFPPVPTPTLHNDEQDTNDIDREGDTTEATSESPKPFNITSEELEEHMYGPLAAKFKMPEDVKDQVVDPILLSILINSKSMQAIMDSNPSVFTTAVLISEAEAIRTVIANRNGMSDTATSATDRGVDEHISTPDRHAGVRTSDSALDDELSNKPEPIANMAGDPHAQPLADVTENTAPQANFYTITTAFMRELQQVKKLSLIERKHAAFAVVTANMDQLKSAIEKVEDEVQGELKTAFDKKLKKTQTQNKNIEERENQIKELRQLARHYSATGQTDKLAELAQQLNKHLEEN